MVEVFAEVWRVLRNEGTLWLSMGDSYARSPAKGGSGTYNGRNGYGEGYTGQKPIPPTLKEKDLCMMPARLALALQAAGWWLRQDIAWVKTAPMPESVRDRFTSRWEHVFLLAKSPHYFFDLEAVKERSVSDHPSGNGYQRPARLSYEGRGQATQWEVTPTRNKRNSWILNPEPYPGAHFATFPQKLVEPCVRAGCPPGGTVLDPFVGSGTVPLVALAHGRHAIGIDLSREYLHLATQRLTPALAQLSLFTRLALTALTEKA
jgi:DNA modification methylase